MKRNLLYIMLTCLLVCMSCDPLVDDNAALGVVPESELNLEVYNENGGNQVVLVNNTPLVGSYWDYIIDISVRERDTVILPFLGEQSIRFTGLCAGGTVNTTRTVHVTMLDHPLAPEWSNLAGTNIAGKTWEWDYDDPSDVIYGEGEYLYDTYPTWWEITAEDEFYGNCPEELHRVMTFDLNGKANYYKKNLDGEVVEQGIFKFDMTKKKVKDNGEVWTFGQLIFTDATILYGFDNDTGETVYTFDIIELTDKTMCLAYSNPDEGYAFFWKFRVKEE